MDERITDLPQLTTPDDADLLEIVDVSDTTDSADGSNKKISFLNLIGNLIDGLQNAIDGLVAFMNGGWIPASETWTRTGDHTFTVSGDLTAKYRPGTKVRYKDGGDFEYGVIGASVHSTGTTTITLIANSDYAMANTTITEPSISYIENPEGFPHYFNYLPAYSASGSMTFTSVTTHTAAWTVKGKTIITELFAEGTIGGTPSVDLRATLPIVPIYNVAVGALCNNGTDRVGMCNISVSNNWFQFRQYDGSNWTAGAGRFVKVVATYRFAN